ncbi:histidine kinase [Paraglaciecola aquimarina]|uniref:Histidine kinase n=1 Tax=Paraglaciecola algarum TaxID=3050085 RepID=A0ABS9DBN6_9ALTE|nr:GAF domain-containing protein [Paraglaciecola sp. G1-23]MCF2949787.1 histidine kinase [Paraglaciecola sp. G1-23]
MDPLLKLVHLLQDDSVTTDEKLRQVCVQTQLAIPRANRVSLWNFNREKTEIVCLMCFDKVSNEYSSQQVLSQTDFPQYFAKILEEQVVMASDARNFSATKCFNQSYFEPLDIYSLLDFVLHKDFQPTGILCCESVGQKVNWTQEDVESLRMLSTMTSYFFG